MGLLGAGQMMFLKVIVAIDPDQNPKDLEAFLDALNDKVEISEDIVVLPGMVADPSKPLRRLKTCTTNCSSMPRRWCPPIRVHPRNP